MSTDVTPATVVAVSEERNSSVRVVVPIATLALLATAAASFSMFTPAPDAAPVALWAGCAFGIVALRGVWGLPIVALAAFAAILLAARLSGAHAWDTLASDELTAGALPAIACGLAFGIGGIVARRLRINTELQSVRDVAILVGCGCLSGAALVGLLAVLDASGMATDARGSFALAREVSVMPREIVNAGAIAVGVLLVAPFFLMWSNVATPFPRALGSILAIVAFAGLAVGTASAGPWAAGVLLLHLPLLVWCTTRWGGRGSAGAIAASSISVMLFVAVLDLALAHALMVWAGAVVVAISLLLAAGGLARQQEELDNRDRSIAFLKKVIDATPTRIGVLDASGTVAFVNATWRDSTKTGGEGDPVDPGVDYVALLEAKREAGPGAVCDELRQILEGTTGSMSLSYGQQGGFYRLKAERFVHEDDAGVAVVLEDLTALETARRDLESARSQLERLLIGSGKLQRARTKREVILSVCASLRDIGWRRVAAEVWDEDGEVEDRIDVGFPRTESDAIAREDGLRVGERSRFIPETGDESEHRSGMWRDGDRSQSILVDSSGNGVGRILYDRPMSGRRPGAGEYQYIEFFVDLAADVIEDIRAEERLAETENRLRTMTEHLKDVVLYESTGRKKGEFVSENIVSMLGYPRECFNDAAFFSSLVHADDRDRLFATCRDWWKSQQTEPLITQARARHADGSYRWLEDRQVIVGARGENPFVAGVMIDITQRKQREQALAAREEQFRAISMLTYDCVYSYKVVDESELEIEWITGSFSALTGYRFEELGARNTWQRLIEADEAAEIGARISHLEPHQQHQYECQIRCKDGSLKWIETRLQPIADADGTVKRILGATQDITRRKTATMMLRQSEQDYRAIFESAHDAILVFDPLDERILDVNDRACEVYGHSREEMLAGTLELFWPTDAQDRIGLSALLEDATAGPVRVRHRGKDGRRLDVEINVAQVKFQGRDVLLSINRDVTESQRQAEVLERVTSVLSEVVGEEFFETLVCVLSEVLDVHAVFVADVTDDWVNIRSIASHGEPTEADGYPRAGSPCDSVLQKGAWMRIDDSAREKCPEFQPFLDQGIESYIGIPLLNSLGARVGILVAMDTRPWSDAAEVSPILRLAAARAASELERLQAESALRASEGRFRSISMMMSDCVYALDFDNTGRVRIAWTAGDFGQLTGYDAKELTHGEAWLKILVPGQDDLVESDRRQLLRGVRVERDYAITTKDGVDRWLRFHVRPVRSSAGTVSGAIGAVEDVTDVRKMDELIERVTHAGSNVTGEAYFDALACELGDALGIKYLGVSELEYDEPTRVRILSMAERGKKFTPPETHQELVGTPCEQVINGGAPVVIQSQLRESFPADHMLVGLGVDSFVGVPLKDSNARTIGLLCGFDDGPLKETSQLLAMLRLVADRAAAEIERLRAENARRESEERFRQIAEHINEVFWLYERRGKSFAFVSPAYEFIWGRKIDPLGVEGGAGAWRSAIANEDRPRVLAAFNRAIAEGRPYAEEYQIKRPDGDIRWIHERGFPILDERGRVYRVAGISEDVTTRKGLERRQTMMLRELNHRVKNNLTAIIALAEQSFHNIDDPDAARTAFIARVFAMSKTHEVLANAGGRAASLRPLISQMLAGFAEVRSDCVTISGADVLLPATLCTPIALAVNELATNAVKYGSLSVPGGSVSVTCSRDGGRLRIVWTESGGPPVEEPNGSGFGSQLITGAIQHDLRGEVEFHFARSGFECVIAIPFSESMGSSGLSGFAADLEVAIGRTPMGVRSTPID